LRFARDLHDLLGHSLSVIVVKAELIRRTASRDPDAATTAAADIETVGRRALVEVRDAVSGYRRADLRAEAARAEHALTEAGIATTVRMTTSVIDPESDAILGWAVREGATNVLRHSGASRCTIAVSVRDERIMLVIADDGAAAARSEPDAAQGLPGNGLRGLSERVAVAGGWVHAGVPREATESPYGATGFLLTVSLPAGHEAASGGCGPGSRDAR
ncbi:MAG TPA: histidine kinase, partial [Nakamurella sp.]